MTLPASAVPATGDAIAVLPAQYKTDSHPVLDALAAGLRGMLLKHEEWSDSLVEKSDALTAEGAFLDEIGQDLGTSRSSGELDGAYRDRALGASEVATPAVLIALANSILVPYSVEVQMCESILDAWYVSNGTANWGAYIGDGIVEISPQYFDRLYFDDADENGGVYRHNAEPGGALTFGDTCGRYFLMRVPALTSLSDEAAMSVYQTIVSAVSRAKGHGVRFALLVDGKIA